MLLIWDYGYRTSTEIRSHLESSHPIHINTVNTHLHRLTARGILHCGVGTNDYRGNTFTPLITKEEYLILLSQAMAADLGVVWEGIEVSGLNTQSEDAEITGPTELVLMLVIWERDGCTKGELTEASSGWRSEPLTYRTITVTLKVLHDKRLVHYEMARRKSQQCCVYRPMFTKHEYLCNNLRAIADSLRMTPADHRCLLAAFTTQTPVAIPLAT